MFQLIARTVSALVAIVPVFAATIGLNAWTRTSIPQLQRQRFLFPAHAEVTSLLSARAASCGVEGACVHHDSEQLFPIDEQQWI